MSILSHSRATDESRQCDNRITTVRRLRYQIYFELRRAPLKLRQTPFELRQAPLKLRQPPSSQSPSASRQNGAETARQQSPVVKKPTNARFKPFRAFLALRAINHAPLRKQSVTAPVLRVRTLGWRINGKRRTQPRSMQWACCAVLSYSKSHVSYKVPRNVWRCSFFAVPLHQNSTTKFHKYNKQ